MTTWRERKDLWNGVVEIRHETNAQLPKGFVAFFIIAESREQAARKLYMELLDRSWTLVSMVNLQRAPQVDDEAADHLTPMAIAAEANGVSFSDFPPAQVQ